MMDLTVMMHEFRQLQVQRCRQYRLKKKVKKMELFENVLIQGARNQFVATIIINQRLAITILPVQPDEASPEVIRPEDIVIFHSGIDDVTINLANERLDPFMIFTSPDETNRFVAALRSFLDYSPEGNANANPVNQNEPNQDQADVDSGRESANSNEL